MQFVAHGKLMLTGEYFVLEGANALAFPTKKVQSLKFKVSPRISRDKSLEFKVKWRSYDHLGNVWFETEIDCKTLKSINQNKVGQKLEQILQKTRSLNPNFLREGGEVEVKSDFNLQWGFGSSSTLVSLVAQWASKEHPQKEENSSSSPLWEVRRALVDPYKIQFECFGGSGYDIACATAPCPIIYSKSPSPSAKPVSFSPSFKKNLYLVYLGKKQNSREGISHYKKMAPHNKEETIVYLNQLTNAIASSKNFTWFCQLLAEHERIISNQLKMETVQELFFSDFDGQTKSLGAWGGDFILAASALPETEVFRYFKDKGFLTILRFRETVL